MALRPIRIDRTSKPPLGTPLRSDGHWSVQGLVGAWAFNEAAGNTAHNGVDVPNILITGAAWEADCLRSATSALLDTGTPTIRGLRFFPDNSESWSVVVGFRVTSSATATIIGKASATTNGNFRIGLSSGALQVRMRSTFTTLGLTPTIGPNHQVAITWDSSNGFFAFDDTSPIALAIGTAADLSAQNVLLSGYNNTSANGHAGLRYNSTSVYSRALSAPEIASLSANPWQIYEPETVWFATTEGGTSGSFTIPAVTLQPIVSAPTLAGAQAGSFTIPAVSLQPQVAAPALAGAQAGSFTIPAVTLQPSVAAPTLTGAQAGSFAIPPVTLQPVVAAPSLTGAQAGSFAIPSVTLQPVVAAPVLTGSAASTGSFTIPSVTLQPIVTAPSLVATSANAIRAPNGTVMDLRDISGNILNLRFMA